MVIRSLSIVLLTGITAVTWSVACGQEEAAPNEMDVVDDLSDVSRTLYEPYSVPCVDCDFDCPVWFGSVDYLHFRPRSRGLDFAIPTDGAAQAVGVGAVQNVEFSYDSGLRAGLGYITPSGLEAGFCYTHFQTGERVTAAAPAGGNLWATRSHPRVHEEAVNAIASADFEYQLFDLEFGKRVEMNDWSAFRMFCGLRWLKTDQQFLVNYDGDDFNNGLVRQNRRDTGFGVRVGGEGRWGLLGGWSMFARGGGTLCYSNTDLRLSETDNSGAVVIVDITDAFSEPISSIEAAFGASWTCGSLDIACGYELTNWFNLGTRVTFDDIHEGAYDPTANDILLDGLFVRLTYVH